MVYDIVHLLPGKGYTICKLYSQNNHLFERNNKIVSRRKDKLYKTLDGKIYLSISITNRWYHSLIIISNVFWEDIFFWTHNRD